jgi:hypothetical protein
VSNPNFSENKPTPAKAKTPSPVKAAPAASMREKPAFQKADLPGGTQPRDRSAGMGRKARIHPKSIGI